MTSKNILITGSSRGLGRAMTESFIERGHKIAGCARNAEMVAELSQTHGSSHYFHRADVADEDDVISFCENAISHLGTAPDLVINNAAVMNRTAPLWEVSAAEMSAIVDVNIEGVANIIRHTVPAMIENASGVIVNFSSYWGRSTSSDVAPYCTTNWAIEGLSSALANDLPGGLGCVSFNPGVINTDMLQSCFGSGASSYGTPEEWAEKSVPFLEGLSAANNGEALTAPGQ